MLGRHRQHPPAMDWLGDWGRDPRREHQQMKCVGREEAEGWYRSHTRKLGPRSQ